jgi:hypothetical protein
MTYEILSTRSWNVLGTFDDENVAREAVAKSVTERGASIGDLVVYVSDDDGHPVDELGDDHLSAWAGTPNRSAAGSAW